MGEVNIKESSKRLIETTFNVNPSWLREGKGEMFLPKSLPDSLKGKINYEMMGAILDGIEKYLKKSKQTLIASKRVELAVVLYDFYIMKYSAIDTNVVKISDYIKSNDIINDIELFKHLGG